MADAVTVDLRVILRRDDESDGTATAGVVADELRQAVEEDLRAVWIGEARYEVKVASIMDVWSREKSL